MSTLGWIIRSNRMGSTIQTGIEMGETTMRQFLHALSLLAAIFVPPAALVAEEPASPFQFPSVDAPSNDVAESALPADVIDLVWEKIDANRDGRATDREAYAAIKPLRVIANAKEPLPLSAAVKQAANQDDVELVTKAEALELIAVVRGQRCPTAKTAKEFFDQLDTSGNGTLEGLEMQAALKPLGDVGRVLFQPVGTTVKSMDLNDNNVIETNEVYLSANAMQRVKLATDGPGIARRNPADWLNFVQAVSALDVNADNVVSPAEAMQVKAVGLMFANIDRNRDRQVTVAELCDYQDQLDIAAQLRSLNSGNGGFS